jgi:hypothetical protein
MNELYFLGMDIVEETRNIIKFSEIICTDGMTESELKAYQMGIENTLSALKVSLETEDNLVAINIEGLDAPTELTVDELQEYYLTI